ncbi:MAG: ABC transporter ATP-binding protein [Pseudomonadota bacterium]
MDKNIMDQQRTLPELFFYFGKILGPEHGFYTLAIIYGVGIGVLSLVTPISVQMLVNSVINTGLTAPLVVLSLTLFGLLLLAGLLNALRLHLVDVFGRRFYARMVSEISLRSIYALNPFFDDNSNGALFNRYFDIVVVMKRIPYLLVGGFSILLQAAVGFSLVSLYHPWFLFFNLVVIALIWIIWIVWGRRAIKSAMTLSHKKHEAAAWLEGMAASNGFFKTRRHIDEALKRTDEVTAEYMKQHKIHFRHYFSQAVSFLVLYALAGSALLGLGGWLVIRGELTVGQLVAAELVLMAVFFGVSQLGTYMSYFYDLCAAVEELSLFYDIEQEDADGEDEHLAGSEVELVHTKGVARGVEAVFHLNIPAGTMAMAKAPSHAVQRLFSNMMKRHDSPSGGYITVGGVDINSIKAHSLRHEVMVLDRPNLTEMTIRKFLQLSGDNVTSAELLAALRAVGLYSTVAHLESGVDTRLAATGWPLSLGEMMQLKLAAALIAKPCVLVLSQLYDMLPEQLVLHTIRLLQEQKKATVIYFSNREPSNEYGAFIYMGRSQQRLFDDPEAFTAHYQQRVAARAAKHPEDAPMFGTGASEVAADA